MGYSFRLAARVLLYASSHRQDNTYLCYTSRGALAGTRNSSMGPPWRIDSTTHAPWANALTTELHLALGGMRNSSMGPPWRIDPTTHAPWANALTPGRGSLSATYSRPSRRRSTLISKTWTGDAHYPRLANSLRERTIVTSASFPEGYNRSRHSDARWARGYNSCSTVLLLFEATFTLQKTKCNILNQSNKQYIYLLCRTWKQFVFLKEGRKEMFYLWIQHILFTGIWCWTYGTWPYR